MISWLPGNAIRLLENGEQYFPALLQAIDNARLEIFLQAYIFQPDGTGRGIAAALERAALRGVAVKVVVDGFGSRAFIDELMPRLLANGVKVQVFRPELRPLSLRRHRLRRLHRKMAVVDGRKAFVGGINIIDDFDPSGPPFPRYDYAVLVQGPILGPALASAHRLWCLLAWARLGRRLELPLRAPAQLESAGDICAAFVVRDNLRNRRAIEDAYLEAICSAREDVLIACAYFFPGRRFRQALIETAQRGVRVTLLLQGVGDHPLQSYATRALYPYFLRHGIRLFEYHRSQLHAKVAVVDQHWATVGSSNIDPFSLLVAREANVFINDRRFTADLRSRIDQAMVQGAAELRTADWRRLSLLQRMRCWLAYQLVRLAVGLAGYGDQH